MKITKTIILTPKEYYQKLGLPSKRFLYTLETTRLTKEKYLGNYINSWERLFIFHYYFKDEKYSFTDDEIKKKLKIPKNAFLHLDNNTANLMYNLEIKNIREVSNK